MMMTVSNHQVCPVIRATQSGHGEFTSDLGLHPGIPATAVLNALAADLIIAHLGHGALFTVFFAVSWESDEMTFWSADAEMLANFAAILGTIPELTVSAP